MFVCLLVLQPVLTSSSVPSSVSPGQRATDVSKVQIVALCLHPASPVLLRGFPTIKSFEPLNLPWKAFNRPRWRLGCPCFRSSDPDIVPSVEAADGIRGRRLPQMKFFCV